MYICLRKYRSPASAVAECRPTFLCPWQLLLTSQSEASLILKYHEGKRAPPPPPTKGQVHHILSFSPFTLYFRTYSFPSSFPSATDIRHKKKPCPHHSFPLFLSFLSGGALLFWEGGEWEGEGRGRKLKGHPFSRRSLSPEEGGKAAASVLGGRRTEKGGCGEIRTCCAKVRKHFRFP